MSLVLIRAATQVDATAIADVKRAAARRAYADLAPADQLDDWLERRADTGFIADRISNPGPVGRYVVATRDGTVVGAGLIRAEGTSGYLADVYCDPPGTGAGTAIVTDLLRHAADHGWTSVRCFTFAGNDAALTFFAAFGFSPTDRIPNQELAGDLLELTR